MLRHMGVDAYFGVALCNHAGGVIGVLAAMHDAPFPDVECVRGLLGVFSGRAVAELERIRMDGRIRHTQRLEGLCLMAIGIAYDINNMLAIIHGQVDILRMAITDGVTDPDKVARRFLIIDESIHRSAPRPKDARLRRKGRIGPDAVSDRNHRGRARSPIRASAPRL
jgi:hypothetical protein